MLSVRSFSRFFMLAVVSVFVLALAVGGVSAAPTAFDPISPGSPTAPGEVFDDITDVLPIQWEEATGNGAVSYVWKVEINGGEPIAITVPSGQTAVIANVVTWVPGVTEAAQLAGAIVDGTYEWYVEATDADGTTTSSSFFFQVDLPNEPVAPGEFDLLLPTNNAYFRVVPLAVDMTWEPSAGADGYIFYLFQISNNARLGEIATLELTSADVGCDQPTATQCILTANFQTINAGGPLANGEYSWTVVAANIVDEIEASNAPFLFSVNLDPIELVSNGGFEAAATASSKNATGWLRVNPTGERRDCRAAKVPANVSGLCAYRATGGAAASILSQKLPNALVTKLGMGELDSLTIDAMVQSVAEPTGAVVRVVIKFTAGTKQKATVSLVPPGPGNNLLPVHGTIDVDDGKGFVKSVSIQILSGTGGVFYVDDLSVKLNPVVLPLTAGAIPVPAAP